MTIADLPPFAIYYGNDVATVFPYSFWIQTVADLTVYKRLISTGALTQLVNGIDYTVSGISVNPPGGGNVTLSAALPSTYKLIIRRREARSQDLDITNQDGFQPTTLEYELDRMTMMIQEISETADRALTVPQGTAKVLLAGHVYSTDINGDMADSGILSTNAVALGSREYVTAPRTYYINAATGNDSLSGLSPGAPFQHIQKAITHILNNLDVRGGPITIQLADGLYHEQVGMTGCVAGAYPVINIVGNLVTPGNVIWESPGSPDGGISSGYCFFANDNAMVSIKGVRFNSSANDCTALIVFQGGVITIDNVEFGAFPTTGGGSHMLCGHGGTINVVGPYKILGNALYHVLMIGASSFTYVGTTVNIPNPITFTYFYLIDGAAFMSFDGTVTFTGSGAGVGSTGMQWNLNYNAGLFLNSSIIPGNVKGVTNPTYRQPMATLTRYVATTGSDLTGDGLTVGTPWRTIQYAVSQILQNWDPQVSNAVIQLATGTYTEAIIISGSNAGNYRQLKIVGNAGTPANVVLSAPAGTIGFQLNQRAEVSVNGVTFSGGLNATFITVHNAQLELQNVAFTAASGTGSHMSIGPGGNVKVLAGTYTVSGNCVSHAILQGPASLTYIIAAISVPNALTFTDWMLLNGPASVNYAGGALTYSGTGAGAGSTGRKWSVNFAASIQLGGTSTTPGATAGVTANGGVVA